MRMLMLIALLGLSACGDVPNLTSPEEAAADRAAHEQYLQTLEGEMDPEWAADCEYYQMETCV